MLNLPLKINSQKPEKYLIQKAAKIIQTGGLVAFPTETVYGLGANALDKKAVRKIFEAKGRPLDNPLIVHLCESNDRETKYEDEAKLHRTADIKDLNKIAKKIPKIAETLIKKFWPGPLTLVLFKKGIVPNEVTAGSNTIAVRMPKNKIALELIKKAGVPIAAPSANLAGRPSPTTAQHVFEDLEGKVDLILDGGPTKIGVESTVVDLTVRPPLILRPGGISLEQLKKVMKDIRFHPSLFGKKFTPLRDKSLTGFKGKAKSPGMKYRHYAPKAPLILNNNKSEIQNLIKKFQKQNKKVGVLCSDETKRFYKKAELVLTVGSRKKLKSVAKNLFTILREFDKLKIDPRMGVGIKKRASRKRCGVDIILCESFPEKGIGLAIMNRLTKAAAKA